MSPLTKLLTQGEPRIEVFCLALVDPLDAEDSFRKQKQKSTQNYIISSYLAIDKEIIRERLDNTLKILENRKAKIIIGTDSNAHHTIWGNTDNNNRGHETNELINDHNLIIENQGNTPTWHRNGCTPSIIEYRPNVENRRCPRCCRMESNPRCILVRSRTNTIHNQA